MAIWLAFIHFAEEGSLLIPDLSLLFIMILFVVLVYFLNAIIFKPITKVIDERDRLTIGAVNEAKQALRNYDQRLTNYQDQIRAARAESYKMLEAQRAAALAERGRILAGVKADAVKKIETKKLEIETAAVEARGRLEIDARKMAETISSNLLKRPLGGASS